MVEHICKKQPLISETVKCFKERIYLLTSSKHRETTLGACLNILVKFSIRSSSAIATSNFDQTNADCKC